MLREKLAELGYTLPEAAAPLANYLPFNVKAGHIHLSGQLGRKADGSILVGRLGDTLTPEQGAEGARSCALALLAQINAGLNGDWSRFVGFAKVTGFITSTPDFTNHPVVINGASDLLVAALGDRGRHARSALGVASLPLGAAVEIDAVVVIT